VAQEMDEKAFWEFFLLHMRYAGVWVSLMVRVRGFFGVYKFF
jgi:hypothetical protein